MAGNARKLVDAARQAHAQGAQLVVTPELALCGYPPEDLLLRPAFMQACDAALQDVARGLADLPGLHVVVGHPQSLAGGDVRTPSVTVHRRLNAASVVHAGQVLATYAKRELPNYQVFDECRYFVSGRDAGLQPVVFDVAGRRVGLLICEDAWFDEPGRAAREAGADVLVVINASPYHACKRVEREAQMSLRARSLGLPLLYAHMVGGQDEMVFDGGSFAVDAQGRLAARAPAFVEDVLHLQVHGGAVSGPLA